MTKLCILALAALPAFAQTITASLEGIVSDPSGAVVAGAKVRITSRATNAAVALDTDATGRFVAPSLPPGEYRVEVEAAGFKRAERSGIQLQVNQSARLDLMLELGAATETVSVNATAPLLESNSSALGQVIANQSIVNLPLNQRNPFALVFLVPGAVGSVGPNFNNANISINGGRPGSNEILADGIPSAPPLVNPIQGYSVFPSVDAVQEFKVQTNSYSAEFGRSGGGIINLIFKSGTNQLHATLFEFLRNSRLDANDFFANSRGIPLAGFQRNQFGGAIGGPVYIPKLHDGRNRTFFHFTYEGLRQGQLANNISTVPTAAQRAGDFSQTFNAANQQVVIFDPVTTAPSGTGFVRQPFAGNVIPASRLDPVGVNIARFYPLPNRPGDPGAGTNNFAASGKAILNINQFDAKGDEILSNNHRFFFRFSRRKLSPRPADFFPRDVLIAQGGSFQPQHFHNAAFDHTWTASPTTLINFRYGIGRTAFFYRPRSDGFDPTTLGFPSYIAAQSDRIMFPGIGAAPYVGLGNGGSGDFSNAAFESHILGAAATKVLTRHVLKSGYEIRMLRVNTLQAGASTGSYSFTRAFTQGPDPNRATATAGDPLASLLVGTGTGTFTNKFKDVATTSWYHGIYLADDFKVTRRLTLNPGIRYEVQVPRLERYDRLNIFNPLVPSPLAGPAGLPGLTGGLEFVGVDSLGRRQYATPYRNIAPRFGFAYELTRNTVVRGGYGLFFAPSLRSAAGTVSNTGYRTDNTYTAALNGVTPTTFLRNPFPNGFTPATGRSSGLLTAIGSPLNAELKGNNTVPYSQNWNFNIQRQLPGNILVETAYVGSRGVHLNQSGEGDYNLNQLTPDSLALGTQLQQSLRNPFLGIITTGPLAAATVPRSVLQRPFPQYTAVTAQYLTGSSSTYHSYQMKVERRFQNGFTLLGSLTLAKLIDDHAMISNVGRDSAIQNIYNRRAERAVSPQDVSKALVVSYVYEIPLGRGHRFGSNWSRAADLLLGQWQVNGVATFQAGQPLTVTTQDTSQSGGSVLRPNNNGSSAELTTPIRDRLRRYFDTSVFSQPAAFAFGNTGRTLPDVRGPGVNNWDFSLFKEFAMTEKSRLQFRAESFNLANRVQFGFPNMVLSSGQMGNITSQANAPRQVQLGLKLLF